MVSLRGVGSPHGRWALRANFVGVLAVGRESGAPTGEHRAARVMRMCAKSRTASVARRRESGAPTGEHRALPQRDRMAMGRMAMGRMAMGRMATGPRGGGARAMGRGRCSLWRRGCGVLHLIGGASFGRIKA